MVTYVLLVLTVLIASAIAVPKKVSKKECRELMDIVFVFDGSDSINAIDYQKQRLAIAAIIQELDIGPNRVKVGFVVYSSNIAQVLNITGNRGNLTHTALNLFHPRDGTSSHKGIASMVQMFEDWGRTNVPRVAFTITDGISKWPKKTAAEAALARKLGVNMYAVGISHTVLTKELVAIASSPDQVYELTSFDQLKDSLSSIMKVVCPCPIPDNIAFATISNGTRVIGVTRTYTCDPRYQPMGNPLIVCQKDAMWSPTNFNCQVCPKPMPEQANAVLILGQPNDFLLGATREYLCIKGFTFPTPRIITCEPKPQGPRWTNLLEPCTTCLLPMPPANTVPILPPPSPIIGDILSYTCGEGYHPNGLMDTKCLDSKGVPVWTPIDAVCITCLKPPRIPHAIVDNTGIVLVNKMRKYACEPGYHATGSIEAICVGMKFKTYWEVNHHKCITCGQPKEVPHTRLETPLDLRVGTNLLYSCLPGYQETGPIAKICKAKAGKTFWVGPDYECIACPIPMQKQNNAVLMPGQPEIRLIGTTMEYQCAGGLAYPYPINITCEATPKGPRWTPVPKVCVGCPMQMGPEFSIANVVMKHPLVGDTIVYKCEDGFYQTGPMKQTCVNEKGVAMWTPIAAACITCPHPMPKQNNAALIHGQPDNRLIGATMAYQCIPGFAYPNPILVVCIATPDGPIWEAVPNVCAGCPMQMGPEFSIANMVIKHPLVGDTIVYKCEDGFYQTGPMKQTCVNEKGVAMWTPIAAACITCPHPMPKQNNAALIHGQPDNRLIGATMAYQCIPGFAYPNPILVVCIATLDGPIWEAVPNVCAGCPMQIDPDFSIPDVVMKHPLVGDTIVYKCLDGYYQTGPMNQTCVKEKGVAMWTSITTACITCGLKLPNVEFAEPLEGLLTIGTIRKYRCIKGFVHNNTPAVKCLPSATWTSPNFSCHKCKLAYQLKNGRVEPGDTFVNTVRQYKCLPGYYATGNITSTCHVPEGAVLPDWSLPVNYCKDCGLPRKVRFAKPLRGPVTTGSKQMYECEPGYVPSAHPYIECMPNAEWDITRFKCISPFIVTLIRDACNDPPIITNAVVDKVGGVTTNSIRTYACDRGYKATGPIEYKCLADLKPAYPPPYWMNITMNYCKDCEEPEPIANGGWLPGPMTIGSSAHYICDKGYAPNGPPELLCQESTRWTTINFKCTGCFLPPIQPFAEIIGYKDGDMALVDHYYEYACILGYKSAGVVKATCTESLTWKMSLNSCGGCEKSLVPPLTNGRVLSVVKDVSAIGTEVFYECNQGYLHNTIPASPSTTCLGTLQWSVLAFECVITCYDPPDYGDAVVNVHGPGLLGAVRKYTCNSNLHGFGDLSLTCLPTGQWSESAFQCYVCVNPPTAPNTVIIDSGPRYVGEHVYYECAAGYASTGSNITTCLPDGLWSSLVIGCSNCLLPPDLHLAKLKFEIPKGGIQVGQSVAYDCLHGYFAAAAVSVTCQPDLNWSFQSSFCEGCNRTLIPPMPNGLVITQLTDMAKVGTVVTYECASGFLHTDTPQVVCLDTLHWSGPLFRCEITCYDPPLFVDALVDIPGPGLLGDVRLYTCTSNLHGFGDHSLTCLPSGQWSDRNLKCYVCVDPPIAPHTIIMDPGPRYLGEPVHYECEAGYAPTGANFTTCLDGGHWLPLLIGCSNCQVPKDLPYAKLSMTYPPGGVLIGQSVPYVCFDGYRSDISVSVMCEPNLNWSPATSFCRGCEKQFIPLIPHANLTWHPPTMSGIGTILPFQCDLGFLPTSTPEVICTDMLLWSQPEFRCLISCGEPTLYPYTKIDTVGGILEGSIRTYTCDPGMSLVGKGSITCLPTGLWSAKSFDCRVCDPPPALEHALPTVNTSTVGFEVLYKCRNGYLAKHPVTSICKPDLTWSTPLHNCTDCGPPQDKPNAYMGLGATTIGTERKYACISGYEMYKGTGVIKCLPTGVWSGDPFSCTVRTTTTTTTPAPVRHDPSLCDQCRMINGVGYNPNPLDCSQYIQCHYGPNGGVIGTHMPCGYGEFWNQRDLSCKPSNIVDCPNDRCRLNPNLQHYKSTDSTKCCAYWICVNGKSVPKCCGHGNRYVTGKGCVRDPNCIAVCPEQDYVPVCNSRPVADITRYEVHIGEGHWVEMPCAYGTTFDPVDCECKRSPDFIPGYVCRPELKLDFEDDTERDNSGKNVYVLNQGVRAFRGAGYFNGSARLLINRFSNTPFNNYLVIKMRYKEELRGPTRGSLQALLTNGDCGEEPSLIMAKMPGFVLLGVHTDKPRSFALPTVESDWKEVVLIHDEKKLQGKVCGGSYSKWSYGPVKSTHCGIQIGYGTKLPNFIGWIDDVQIYQCLPKMSQLLTLYQGPRFRRDDPEEDFLSFNVH